MPDDKIIFKATGGTKRANNIAMHFINCVTAADAAVRNYDDFRARCLLGKTQPPPLDELKNTARIMTHFAAMMLSGDSLTFTAPGVEEIAALLRRALFGPDAPVSDAVIDDPGSV